MYISKIVAFFRCILKSGIAGSYGSHCGNHIFRFLKILYTVFHTGKHQQYTRVSSFPYSYQYLSLVDFLMILILTGGRWYLIVALICISLIVILSIFSCLLAICMSSLEKCLSRFSAYSKIVLLFDGVIWAVNIFWLSTSCQSYNLQIFSPIQ